MNLSFRKNIPGFRPIVLLCAVLGINSAGHAQYCTPAATNSTRYINNFSTTLGSTNISNLNSGASPGGYGNFSATQMVTAAPGSTFNFSINFDGTLHRIRIWVDWNNDNDFTDAGEVAFESLFTSFGGYNGTISVPATAAIGTKRMRVGSNSAPTPIPLPADACTTVTYGEFEDYSIVVSSSPVACTTPTALTENAITATSAVLDWAQAGTPAQWQIKYGPAGFNVATGGTSIYTTVKPYTLNPPLTPATAYDYYVRAICAPGDTTAWSAAGNFTTLVCTPPNITFIIGGERCGPGTVQLDATTIAGATINWYTAATGGTPVATGNTFTTPSLSLSTNYYITAISGTCESSPRQQITAAILDLPEPALGNDTSICNGDQITLNAGNLDCDYEWSTGAITQTIQVGNAGTYSVTITTADNCSLTEEIQVTTLGDPLVDGLTFVTLFQEQARKVRFMAQNPVHVETYEWNFGDGSAISTAAQPEHVYAANGNYTVTLKVRNKCGTYTKSANVTISGSTAIAMPDNEAMAIKLYPNPAHDQVRISCERAQVKHITVCNVVGSVVYDHAADQKEYSLRVTGWAPGLYLFRILTDKGWTIRKLEIF